MAKNLLLEYSEELATKCALLCKSISGNSNTVFQLRKSSSSVRIGFVLYRLLLSCKTENYNKIDT